ncbi:hypothetical protein BB561_002292 [Smittium simulii]|uniref:FAD dependent oxidoreductase domain-containing protein n=1 Tax=Smittium simulii TaxID=133385 RepID=A0A2T9YQZ0_9FUNG|nr:hypothetical protein BB561_002292 [Smittium simulii]
MSTQQKQHIIILGAGVIGLTTALVLQRSGKYQVLIVSEHKVSSPSLDSKVIKVDDFEFRDPTTVPALKMASPYSGSHWRAISTNTEEQLQKCELQTYNTFMSLVKSNPAIPVKIVEGNDIYTFENTSSTWHFDHMHDFSVIKPSELPKGIKMGVKYKTLIINSPQYLVWLFNEFTKLGGLFKQAKVNSLRQLELFVNKFGPSNLPVSQLTIINCSALGSAHLTDVKDRKMHPIRGQVVVVYAPQVNRTVTKIGGKFMRYVIPRGDGTVILGGTHLAHDYNSTPNDQTTEEILAETLELVPELILDHSLVDPKQKLAQIKKKVLAVKVGFRPARLGGTRLEHDKIYGYSGNTIKVIHNYGHNGYGVQSSWGYANMVYSMLQQSKL